MHSKTEGESAFERFCSENSVTWRKVATASVPTPDYEIDTGTDIVFVEIKQIDSSNGFETAVKTRTVGSHVRAKIGEARKQAQTTAGCGHPFVLVIFNNLDPLQTMKNGDVAQFQPHTKFLTGPPRLENHEFS